jgi:hypothetical protein
MIVMLSVVGMGMCRCAREGWPAEAWLLVAGVAVMWGMATVALSIARYMMPVIPLLAVFVGYC